MAGASSADLNQDFSGTGYWGRYIDHLRRTASANESYRFHRIFPNGTAPMIAIQEFRRRLFGMLG
jgi:hypothetical protein